MFEPKFSGGANWGVGAKLTSLCITALVVFTPSPTLASDANIHSDSAAASELALLRASYEPRARMLFIGVGPADSTQVAASVTVSRASDLVGTPLRTASRLRGNALVSTGPASLPKGMPLASARMTSSFGARVHPVLGNFRQHRGIDFAAQTGSPVMATADGIVGVADWNGGYGLFVALDHGNRVQTRYGHLSRLNVTAGQKVRKGDVIAYVGSTGRSTGPHLHYEVRVNGQAINPASLVQAK